MHIRNFNVLTILTLTTIILFGCGVKKETNKYIGIWQDKEVTIILEENGIGNIVFNKRSKDNQGLKWKENNDYIMLEFEKKKGLYLYAKIANTGDNRTMNLYETEKFTKIFTVLIKNVTPK